MNILSKIKDAKKRLSGFWAIEKNSYNDIVNIYDNFSKNPKSFIESISEPDAMADLFNMKSEEILFVEGSEAIINIIGPLVDSHDCATIFFGCTSYDDIISAISEVEEMDHVENVVFNFDSPGGMVSGVDNAAIAIRAMKKTTEARSGRMVASAAYWLASQCDSITATCATAQFGSIGVVIEYWDQTRKLEEEGFDKVCITSTNAPDKRVDALSDEGRRKIKSNLDDIEEIFHRRIADGRKTSVSKVIANFGRGGMFLAEKSLSAGMIDKNDFTLNNIINSNNEAKTSTEEAMSLKEYLKKNPDAQKEYDTDIAAAGKSNTPKKVEVETEIKTEATDVDSIDRALKIVSSGTYPTSINELAVKVIKGKVAIDSLESAVAAVDAMKEINASDTAIEETEDLGETPSSKVEPNKDNKDGVIADEDTHSSAIERIKKLKS